MGYDGLGIEGSRFSSPLEFIQNTIVPLASDKSIDCRYI